MRSGFSQSFLTEPRFDCSRPYISLFGPKNINIAPKQSSFLKVILIALEFYCGPTPISLEQVQSPAAPDGALLCSRHSLRSSSGAVASSVACSDPGIFNCLDPKPDGIVTSYQRTNSCIRPQGRKTPCSQLVYLFKCDSLYYIQCFCLSQQTVCLFLLKFGFEQQPVD